MLRSILFTALAAFAAPAVQAGSLDTALHTRLHGDRSGACIAAALIDGERVEQAFACADPAAAGGRMPDARTGFEIGSVSKTMTATLLAQLIAEGRASLDDPLSRHLPPGARVPDFKGEPIRLRHLVTHTAGLPALPPGFTPPDPADPYATLTPETLLAALARTELKAAPGTAFEYSNFGGMLASYLASRIAGQPFDRLLRERLFTPLGMSGAYVPAGAPDTRAKPGHLPNGQATPPWTFHPDLAGVGGVRASLDDMVRYVQAQLDPSRAPALQEAIRLTHTPVQPKAQVPMGMNWLIGNAPRGTVLAHEGGTGGFSSLVAFNPVTRKGVVLLSDTALHSMGGLGLLGMHLLDPAAPAPVARKAIAAPAPLLDALAGPYELQGGLRMTLSHAGGVLRAQVDGQPTLEMGYDDAGDFYPLTLDATLRPQRQAGGGYGFAWIQGGGVLTARRIDAPPAPDASRRVAPAALDRAQLQGYAGTYPLVPGFALKVFERDARLHVQGTGQPALAVDMADKDVFVAPSVNAELQFERDESGAVVAVTLRQGGQTLRGARTP